MSEQNIPDRSPWSHNRPKDIRDIPFGPWPRGGERLMRDVTAEYDKMRAELLLIRVQLGLSPIHDVRWAIDKLYNDGREAFEEARGPRSDDSASWVPRS